MQQKLREYLDQIFANAPNTRRVMDLKDELYANLLDKYQDMLAQGRTEQESFDAAVRSIGDVNELLWRVNEERVESEEDRKKTAKVVAGCVGLYILALIVTMILGDLPIRGIYSGLAFFIIAGGSTCILIYHFMSRPRYVKKDDTVVEEFKQWSSKNERSEDVFKTVSSVLWLVTVALFFIISFAFRAWAFSWVIFILAAAVQNIIRLFFNQSGKGN